MENNKVNAEWARKEAAGNLGAQAAADLSKCLDEIKNAVSRNEMSTHIRIKIEPAAVKELQSRGFVVEVHDNQYDGASVSIKW